MGDAITAVRRAITTASNDDTSTKGSETRARHSQRLFAMQEAVAEIERLRAALQSIYTESMRCAGDADSMAMCIVSTQGVARAALNSTESST